MFGRKKNMNASSSAKNCEAAKETASKTNAKSSAKSSKCSCGKKSSSTKACK